MFNKSIISRTPEDSTSGRGVRAVAVYTLPAGACAGADEDAWAPRHLTRGAPTIPATGAIGPVRKLFTFQDM